MAKLTAILVTIIGILMVLQSTLKVALPDWVGAIVIPIAVLAIGIGKLLRNYK